MIGKIATTLKRVSPVFLYNGLRVLYRWLKPILKLLHAIYFKIKLKKVQANHKKALEKVRKKEKIKVAFILIHESVWKYDGLYKLMEQDDRIDPIVIVCPYTAFGDDIMFREMIQTNSNFIAKGYNVTLAFNETNQTWLNIKETIKPDIVFFTNPWNLTRPEYLITNFLDTLTCYVPYGFKNSYLYQAHFNGIMQNFVWKFFLETEIHKKLSKKYARNNSSNTLVTGYPGMDKFLNEDYEPKDVWKNKDKNLKKIIWAPHHTIPGMGATLDYSTFLIYAESMLELANKYKNSIQIAFKPHPVLRGKLSKSEVWGVEKTNKYYETWKNLPNGGLHEGDYIDLFFTSDGMVHDSSSFVIEYFYTKKPVMFLINDDTISDRFNEVGKIALSRLYKGRNLLEIEQFILQVIINEKDTLKHDREDFFNSIVKPPNHRTASENIYEYLISEIFNEK